MDRSCFRTEVPYSGLTPKGTVRLFRIAEWFQDAAVHASALGGYPQAKYEEMGASWFVQELEVLLDHPIGYGEPIAIETWVSDLRRFRSHREYLARDGSGRVVARGRADWLFLRQDPLSRRVRPLIPDEALKAAFPLVPERAIEDELPLAIPDSVPSVTMTRTVRPTELDRHDHVNHTAYVAWIEDLDLPIRRVHLRFEKDARPGDELVLRGWFDGRRGAVEARRGDVRVFTARIE